MAMLREFFKRMLLGRRHRIDVEDSMPPLRLARRRQTWLPSRHRKAGGVVIRSAIDARLYDGRRMLEEHL
jgi:hypothetical protein